SDCCRWIENNLSTVQSQYARALGKVTVIADINSDARVRSVKRRVTEIPRFEIKLLPEPRIDVGNMMLSILAEISSIRIDHRGGVVVDAGHLFLINRHD